jgi:hypothetical protein
MNDIPIEEIPANLKIRFDEENKLNNKLDTDQVLLEDCGNVYIVSYDIIQNWRENSIMQIPDDIY